MVTKATMGLLVALGVLAACSTPPRWSQWEKAGVTGAEVKKDSSSCQAFASSEADRRYRRENPAEDMDTNGPGSAFRGAMATNDAALFQKKVYDDCMASHGYKKPK